jgi:hypothetical protein
MPLRASRPRADVLCCSALDGAVTMWENGDMAVGPLMDASTFFIWLIA